MDDGDGLMGERDAGIELLDGRIIPGGNGAEIHLGNEGSGELELLTGNALQVVGQSFGSQRDRYMKNGAIGTLGKLRTPYRFLCKDGQARSKRREKVNTSSLRG